MGPTTFYINYWKGRGEGGTEEEAKAEGGKSLGQER